MIIWAPPSTIREWMSMEPRCLGIKPPDRPSRSAQAARDPRPRGLQPQALASAPALAAIKGERPFFRRLASREKPQAAVHDYRLIGALHQPDVETGIVGQHRADTHQDGLVGSPGGHSQGHGLGAAVSAGGAGAVGNTTSLNSGRN